MTTARQIYQLQELDQEIAELRNSMASLERELEDHSKLESLQAELSQARGGLEGLQAEQRQKDLELGSLRQRLDANRRKLYGGTVTNIRELEALEKDVALGQAELQRREEALLELMLAIEEAQASAEGLQASLTAAEADWKLEHQQLTDRWQETGERLEEQEKQRQEWASSLPSQELRLYESLRASKGGMAVARVERGLCRGCLMALPTHQLQQARMSKEPVRCNSCGRILFVS